MTKIEWTDDTLQLTYGCTKVSDGCRNCYAERMHPRLAGMGKKYYAGRDFGKVICPPERIDEISKIPQGGKRSAGGFKKVFINSMSDLFHPDVPDGFIIEVFCAMAKRQDIIFQVLTKRPGRILTILPSLLIGRAWSPNIWLGVTAENQAEADRRIPLLLQVPAAVRFVSVEPMLGPVDLERYFVHIDSAGEPCAPRCNPDGSPMLGWVIVGGETGPGARPMHPDWVRSLRDQCQEAGVPFFFKGWGEWGEGSDARAKRLCIYRDGRTVEFTKEAITAEEKRSGIGHQGAGPMLVSRVGKKAAGRVLDGRPWEELPGCI